MAKRGSEEFTREFDNDIDTFLVGLRDIRLNGTSSTSGSGVYAASEV